VRGLIAHSAEWTPAMRAHLPAVPTQNDKRALIRRYGYGVPDLTRAIRSLSNDVSMVIEGNVQPYQADGSEIKTRDMMLHDLPWPDEALEGLGQQIVQMKVTLSYFIEPNPGEQRRLFAPPPACRINGDRMSGGEVSRCTSPYV
jgi:hypothetical protein